MKPWYRTAYLGRNEFCIGWNYCSPYGELGIIVKPRMRADRPYKVKVAHKYFDLWIIFKLFIWIYV